VVATAGFEDTRYRENDGVNHVNQALINDGAYLTGGATDPSTISGLGTEVTLGNPRQISARITIDEPDGNGAHSVHAKGQLIQTFKATDSFSITNNTFYDYINRYNQVMAYYADTAKGSYTIENKTDFKVKFGLGSVSNDIDAGFTYRYAHVLDIQNYANEPVSVFDLSQSPSTFVFPASAARSPTRQPSATCNTACRVAMAPTRTRPSTRICRMPRFSSSTACSSRRSGVCCTDCVVTSCS
jgi:hypothetical protein